MLDIVFIAATAFIFSVGILYLRACEKMRGRIAVLWLQPRPNESQVD